MALLHSPRIITNGLILCLDAADKQSYSGSGTVWRNLAGSNNGTLTNGPTFNSANAGSIVFDGSNDHVRVGAVTSQTTGNITYNIWFKTNTLASTQTLFWDDNNAGGGDAWIQITTLGAIQTQRDSDGFRNLFTPSSTIIINTWYNLCFVASTVSPRKSLYLNGVLVASDNTAIGTRFNRSYLTLGASFDGVSFSGGGRYLNGNISTFAVYNRALAPAQIRQNYNATKGRYNL
jgi:hypothetical protein